MKKHSKKLIVLFVTLTILISTFSIIMSASAASQAYGAATVNANGLRIREKAGTSYDIIGSLNKGNIIVVLSKSSSGWYYINYNGVTGYVDSDYLTNVCTRENFSAYGKINADSVRVRSGPSTSDSVVGTYSRGTGMNVIGINNGWYKVQYNGKTGYVRSDYFTITGAASGSTSADSNASSAEAGYINASNVRLRKSASTSAAILDVIPKNAKVSVLGKSGDWYKISYDGQTGFAYATYVTLNSSVDSETDDSSASGEAGYINASSVRLRKSASTSAAILDVMSKNSKITIYSKSGDWYKIDYNGTVGYAYGSYVSKGSVSSDNSTSSGEAGYINASSVRLRKSASTSAAILDVMSKNSKITIYSKSGDWYKISYNGTVGYAYSSYVSKGTVGSGTSTGSGLGSEIAEYALQFVGYDYVYGAESPSVGFDCSGLVYYVYGEYGYTLNRRASQQWKHGTEVSKSELQPGDLVFFSSDSSGITHVGIYIGGNQFVHASTSKTGVIISDLTSSYYERVWYGARRIVG